MENNTLHQEKVAILSRLIKETSLTLEEALLLLKQEEPAAITVNPNPAFYRTYNPQDYFTITTSGTVGIGTSTPLATSTLTIPSSDSADLNN